MNSNYLTSYIGIYLVLIFGLLITGCEEESLSDIPDEPGSVSFAMNLDPLAEQGVDVHEVEISLTPWGDGDTRVETITPSEDQINETISDLDPGNWDVEVRLYSEDEELLGEGSKEGVIIESGETTELTMEITVWLDPETGELSITVIWNFEERRMSAEEDCTFHDPDDMEVEESNDSWRIVRDDFVVINFGSDEDSEENARRGLEIIQAYHLTNHCYVGRPNPPMSYMLSNEIAPRGDIGDEDCTFHSLDAIEVVEDNGTWRIDRDDFIVLSFGSDEDSEELAREAFDLIHKYQFEEYCYVGRPNPPMTYMKAK